MTTSETIGFADPKASYLAHQQEIDAAVHRVLDSGRYILGPEVDAFEQEFARYLGLPYVLGVANGTDALQLALRACGVGPGDGVVTVSHTAVATVAAIELTGATPVLVDIDPRSYTLDPTLLAETIKRTAGRLPVKAVVPVHLYGHPADMPAILEIAQRYRLYVIEDCAQAHGATLQRRKTGVWGHLAAFSLYPTKNLGALGDGGAVATADAALAEKVRLLREYGWKERYFSNCGGMNSRLDELQAAILRVKLQHLDAENQLRRELAAVYDRCLQGTPWALPVCSPDASHVYHLYVVRGSDRNGLREFLKMHGVGTAIHYPLPVHQQPAYLERLPIGAGGLEKTNAACREIVSLPMHPHLSVSQVQQVAQRIGTFSARQTGHTTRAA